MAELNEDFYKKRLEKDLAELKKMIETHFVQRKKDEEDLVQLETRITERKEMREKQILERAQREKDRLERDRLEKEKKEAEEQRKADEEAARKKEAMAKMTNLHSGASRQRKGKATARDLKKKVLGERRKPLNIDHMDPDKLKQKCKDLWDYLHSLEVERYDYDYTNDDKKYEVNLLRYRVNMLSGKASKEKTKRIGRINKK